MDQIVRVALIGCGRISFKHVEALNSLGSKYELVAVCDVEQSRAIEKAGIYSAHSQPAVYTDLVGMLDTELFELGVVATESGYHYEHAMALLNKGKHVIVEKPIALSTKDANEMIQLAKENGLILSVCHQNRFNPPVKALRKAIEKKRFGRVINGTARILWTRDQNYYDQAPWRGTAKMDGGTLMNQCIHDIDLLLWMMESPVESVYGQTGTFMRNIEMEDLGVIVIRFKNGSIGLVEGSACVFPKNLEETLSIFGENGTVVIGGLAVNEMETWAFADDSVDDQEYSNMKDDISNVYGNGHAELYSNVYDAIRNGAELIVKGEDGALAMNVILAAYQSQVEMRVVAFDDFEYATERAERMCDYA